MGPKFIELEELYGKPSKILININHITAVRDFGDHAAILFDENPNYVEVKDDYHTVTNMIYYEIDKELYQ